MTLREGLSSFDVREERSSDKDAIYAVHEQSFPTPAEAKLVDALRDAGNLSISLVCCDRDAVVGHVAFSPVSVGKSIIGLGLGPVAVLPGQRRRGIAESLIRAGLERCKALEYKTVVVLGEPAYYGRFGFKAASKWGLVDEYGGGEAFQVLELVGGGVTSSGGTVRYSPEFATASEGSAT